MEIAKSLLKQADRLDDESRTISNHIQTKSTRFQTVAETIRKLVNHMIEHNKEIQNRIETVFTNKEVHIEV